LSDLPFGVVTEIRPGVAPDGTVVAIVVVVEELGDTRAILNSNLSFATLLSKLVPVMVTAVPATPSVGVNPVIAGVMELTVYGVLLVAEPLGVVTAIVPVVAPVGTVVSICVAVDDVTVAVTPLNCRVF